jgi:hypothetical protein
VEYEVQIPVGSTEIYEFYSRSLREQGWKSAAGENEGMPRFIPLAEERGQCLSNVWINQGGDLLFILVIKSRPLADGRDGKDLEKQEVNINVALRAHVQHLEDALKQK